MDISAFDLYETMNTLVKESYEVLKTNIQLYDFGQKIKTLTITSYRAREGKTRTALNLAIATAYSGKRVLFVDADMHKPEFLKDLRGTKFKGLSNYLIGDYSLDDVVNSTSLYGFDFISCGVLPVNPAGLLDMPQFDRLIEDACSIYDFVIFDTPPLGSVVDSMVVAAKTDGTIFVIEPGKVSSRNIKMITNQMQKSNVKLLGVVLNKVQKSEYKSYFREYDYYSKKKNFSQE